MQRRPLLRSLPFSSTSGAKANRVRSRPTVAFFADPQPQKAKGAN